MIQYSEIQYDTHPFPLQAFQVIDDQQLEVLQKQKEQEEKEEKKEKDILCRNCRNKVTSGKFIIDVNGAHRHIFNNPEGVVFEIGCFAEAEGCINHGILTSYFSWFAGYSWCFSMCSKCLTHLGWFYQSGKGSRFNGLILSHLIEEE